MSKRDAAQDGGVIMQELAEPAAMTSSVLGG